MKKLGFLIMGFIGIALILIMGIVNAEFITIQNPNNLFSGFIIEGGGGGGGSTHQWGNNCSFNPRYVYRDGSYGHGNASGYGPGNPYYNCTFYQDYDWSSVRNPNLRGGGNDNESNNFGLDLNNQTDRKGPCGTGYHVPSAGEWSMAFKYWCDSNPGKCTSENMILSGGLYYNTQDLNIGANFANDLHMSIENNDSYIDFVDISEPWVRDGVYLWTSSPNYKTGGYNSDKSSIVFEIDANGVRANGIGYRGDGYPLICFRDFFGYFIKFDSRGGSNIDSQTVMGNFKAVEPSSQPEKNGYIFSGWFTDNGTFENKFDFESVLMNDITLYAKWIPINYDITYELNDGIITGDVDYTTGYVCNTWLYNIITGYTIESNNIVLPKNLTKTGYKFLGRTGSNGTVPNIDVNIPQGSTGNKKYYANWEKNPRYIYNSNGGEFEYGETEKVIKTNHYEKNLNLGSYCNPSRKIYINIPLLKSLHVTLSGNFSGIALYIFTGDFMGQNLNYEDSVSGYLYKLDKDSENLRDFYINKDTYDNFSFVTTNCCSGCYYCNYPKIIINTNIFIEEITEPIRTGYTFSGWYESGATNEYDSTQPVVEDKVLYAHRKINQYTITFKDGENEITSIMADYGTGITPPTNPTKNGYRFIGWEPEIPATMPAEDMTINAVWERNGSSGGGGGGGGGGRGSSSSSSSTGSDTSNQQSGTGTNNSTGAQNDQTTTGINVNEPEIEHIDDSASSGTNAKDPENNSQVDSSAEASEGQSYSTEFQQAYEFAKGNGITTMPTIQKADMNGNLTRIAMAKMLSQYAINVLGQKPANIVTPKFNDVSDERDEQYDNGVTLAYQLGIMGQNMPNNNFRPDDEVTRAEFATALSRMLYATSDGIYKSTSEYYTNHMKKLKEEGIITKDDPKMKELRGYVMIMLMRSAE